MMQAFFFLLDKAILFPDPRRIKTTRKPQMPIMTPDGLRPFRIFIKLHDRILNGQIVAAPPSNFIKAGILQKSGQHESTALWPGYAGKIKSSLKTPGG